MEIETYIKLINKNINISNFKIETLEQYFITLENI